MLTCTENEKRKIGQKGGKTRRGFFFPFPFFDGLTYTKNEKYKWGVTRKNRQKNTCLSVHYFVLKQVERSIVIRVFLKRGEQHGKNTDYNRPGSCFIGPERQPLYISFFEKTDIQMQPIIETKGENEEELHERSTWLKSTFSDYITDETFYHCS